MCRLAATVTESQTNTTQQKRNGGQRDYHRATRCAMDLRSPAGVFSSSTVADAGRSTGKMGFVIDVAVGELREYSDTI